MSSVYSVILHVGSKRKGYDAEVKSNYTSRATAMFSAKPRRPSPSSSDFRKQYNVIVRVDIMKIFLLNDLGSAHDCGVVRRADIHVLHTQL